MAVSLAPKRSSGIKRPKKPVLKPLISVPKK